MSTATDDGGKGGTTAVQHVFAATAREGYSLRRQQAIRGLFLLTTMLLVLPVLAILGKLAIEGGPALTWEFFSENPRNGMKDGGTDPQPNDVNQRVTQGETVDVQATEKKNTHS